MNSTIVIGGGLAGVLTAYELASRGMHPTLLEAGGGLGEVTSFRNGAMMTPSMPEPWNGPGIAKALLSSLLDPGAAMKMHPKAIPSLLGWGTLFLRNSTPRRYRDASIANFQLSSQSLIRTGQLIEELGIRLKGESSGTLKLFKDEFSMAAALSTSKLLKSYGFVSRCLSAEESVEIEPELAAIEQRIHGALHYPGDRVGDAHDFTQQIGVAAQAAGAEIRLNSAVRRIVKSNGVFEIITDDETLQANTVVLAAGNSTQKLARHLKVKLPICPVKGYSITIDAGELLRLPRIAVVDEALHIAIVPLGDRLRVVGSAELIGMDNRISEPRIKNLSSVFEQVYPALFNRSAVENAEHWAGLRAVSADGRPFIGQTKVPGLWINSGHGHLGWTMAAGSAQLLADQMCGAKTKIDVTPYAVINR